MAELRPRVETLRTAGVNVAVIGSGGPSFARGFREQLHIDVPIFSDEKRRAFAAAELVRGKAATLLDPRMALKAARAVAQGFRQTRTKGDPWQQGGALVVEPDGRVPFQYISRFAGDHPPVEDLVAAALAARPTARG